MAIPCPLVSIDADATPSSQDQSGITAWEVRSRATHQLHNLSGPASVDATSLAYYINGINLTKQQWLLCTSQGLYPTRSDDGGISVLSLFKDNVRHAEGMPAVIREDGQELWYRHGVLHRTDGPAVSHTSPQHTGLYYLSGIKLSESEYDAWKQMGPLISFTKNGEIYCFNKAGDCIGAIGTMEYDVYAELIRIEPQSVCSGRVQTLMMLGGLSARNILRIFKVRDLPSIDVYIAGLEEISKTTMATYEKSAAMLSSAIEAWLHSALSDATAAEPASEIEELPQEQTELQSSGSGGVLFGLLAMAATALILPKKAIKKTAPSHKIIEAAK